MDQEHHFQGRWLVEHIFTRHPEQGSDLGVGGPAGGGEAGEGGERPREAAGEAGGDGRTGQGPGRAGGIGSIFIFVFLQRLFVFMCLQVEELRQQGREYQRQMSNQAVRAGLEPEGEAEAE